MKKISQNAKPLSDANLLHIQKLNLKLYQHYVDLLRLYAFSAGKRKLKTINKKRNAEDERRLIWSVKNLKEKINKIEYEAKAFIEKYL